MEILRINFGTKACDEYLAGEPNANLYQLSAIQKVIFNTFGHESIYIYAKEGDRVCGVLPLIQMQSRLFGNFLISVPFFNYGGVCAENSEIRHALLDYAAQLAKQKKVSHIELRHSQIYYSDLQNKAHKVAMILPLPGTTGELWKLFKSKLRSQIRRPEKEGITAKIGKEELLDHFYSVFAANMRDLGTPVYTKKLFQNMMKELPGHCWIAVAYKEEKPLAAGFLAGFGKNMEIPWASSLREYNKLSPNMLMYWEALKLAINEGYENFDFGRSTPDEGTFKFKQQWGAEPLKLYWEYWMQNIKPLPDISPENSKFQTAIKIWQKLPLCITKLIGPQIVKNIP